MGWGSLSIIWPKENGLMCRFPHPLNPCHQANTIDKLFVYPIVYQSPIIYPFIISYLSAALVSPSVDGDPFHFSQTLKHYSLEGYPYRSAVYQSRLRY